MHCVQCDKELSDFEATRKDLRDGSYLDLCNTCYRYVIGLFPVSERYDLWEAEDESFDSGEDFDESNVQTMWSSGQSKED